MYKFKDRVGQYETDLGFENEKKMAKSTGAMSGGFLGGIISVVGGLGIWGVVLLLIVGLVSVVVTGYAVYKLIISVAPFIIAGIVFILFYYIFDKHEVDSPWQPLAPIAFSIIALLPMMVSDISQATANMVSVQAVGGFSATFSSPWIWVAIVISIILFVLSYWFARVGTVFSILFGFSGFGLVMLVSAMEGYIPVSSTVLTSTQTQTALSMESWFFDTVIDTIVSGPAFIAISIFLVFLAVGLTAIQDLGHLGKAISGGIALTLVIGLGIGAVGVMEGEMVSFSDQADMKYTEVTTGEIIEGDKLWRYHDNPTGPYNETQFDARISGITKAEDYLHEEYTNTDGSKERVYRWESKTSVGVNYATEYKGWGDWNEQAVVRVDPPSYKYRGVDGEQLSQDSFKPIKYKIEPTGDISTSSLEGSITNNKFGFNVDAPGGGWREEDIDGSLEVRITFEKTVNVPQDTSVDEPGGGDEEGLMNIPIYVWIIPLMAGGFAVTMVFISREG